MSYSPHSSNRLLASLAEADLGAILPYLTTTKLPRGAILFEDGDTISRVYFPHSGIVSLLVELASGEMIETAMIGRESVVGGMAALGNTASLNKAVVQIAS